MDPETTDLSPKKAIVDESDEDDDDDEDDLIKHDVHLGFLVKGRENMMFNDGNWSLWDGGIVGGKPSWLDPVNLPSPNTMQCQFCHDPMIFLLQIYCPLDDNPQAFHRSLYIFCCTKSSCFSKGAIKCYRCQLPRINHYYAATATDPLPNINRNSNLCALCGCSATNSCSKCKVTYYCSKLHQKLNWKDHKLDCDASINDKTIISPDLPRTRSQVGLYPEYDIDVDSEELDDYTLDKIDKMVVEANIWDDAMVKEVDNEDADKDLTQKDYNQSLGNTSKVDAVYDKFIDRIRRGGNDQVLRYCRWKKESRLFISSVEKRKTNCNFLCQICGAPKEIEFQVLPQLLYFLNVDAKTKVPSNLECAVAPPTAPPTKEEFFKNNKGEDIDFGTIDIYTCTNSCSQVACVYSSYIEESVYIQSPVLE